jgi:hypothetical protein
VKPRPPINKKSLAGRWVVSENEETFGSSLFLTKDSAIAGAAGELDLEPGDSFFVAQVANFDRVLNLGDPRRVLEEAGERSECHECVYDGMANALTEVEGAADEDLNRVLSAWLRRWGLHPNQHGYRVERCEKAEVPVP